MSEKVLSREVAEELQELRNEGWTDYRIIARIHDRWTVVDKSPLIMFAHQHPSPLLRALADGYEVEQSPEDRVREYYESQKKFLISPSRQDNSSYAIRNALNLLNIKIEGVNA